MAGRRRPGSAGKAAMFRKKMAEKPPGKKLVVGKAGHEPKSPAGVKKLAAHSRAKQVKQTPDPGKAVARIPIPTAAAREMKKKKSPSK